MDRGKFQIVIIYCCGYQLEILILERSRGSAVGDPLFYSGVPILHAAVVITLTLVFLDRVVGIEIFDASRGGFTPEHCAPVDMIGFIGISWISSGFLFFR